MIKLPDSKIYLASRSPRRRELLRQIGVDFELLLLREIPGRGPEVSEEVLPDEAAFDYVTRIAREKAEHAYDSMMMRQLRQRPILSADTTVTLDGRIFGKPGNRDEAMNMLRTLSGRTHEVLTSVAVKTVRDFAQLTQVSRVTFAPLSDAQIAAYCGSSEPYDKAGGYAVQGHAAAFISEIQGSHSGIMGLPLYETAQLLKRAGVNVP